MAAVSLLMILAPASAGTVHPGILLKAPYKTALTLPNWGSSVYGCGAAKATIPKWVGKVGMVADSVLGVGKTCKSYGNYGGGGSGYGSGGIEVLIPFKVATTGNHTLASSWTVTLSTVKSFTYGGCPGKNINYFPSYGQSSYGQCYDSSYISWGASSWVTDVSNNSWYNYNYSSGYSYNSSYFSNYTSCYNYGTPSCYNSSYGSNYSYAYGYNAPGFATFTMNGATSFTFWNNATNMMKTDQFALVFDFYMYVSGSASATHLLSPWAVTAGGSINMATLGNGAMLNSVNIV